MIKVYQRFNPQNKCCWVLSYFTLVGVWYLRNTLRHTTSRGHVLVFLSQKGWSTSQVSGFKIKTQTGYMFITSMFFTSMFLLLNSPFKASKVFGLYSSNCIGVAMSLFFRLANFNRTYYSILIRFSLVFQRSITSLATNLVLATNSRLHQLFCWSTFLLIVNISKRKLLQQQNNQEIKIT